MPYNYPLYSNPYMPYNPPYSATQATGNNLPQNNPQTPQTANNGIIWVQGEAGAKSYLVGAGNSVLLMDSEQSRFYIKSTDNSGMPMPLRTFEYSEISSPNSEVKTVRQQNDFVTHEELEERLKLIETKTAQKKEVKDNAKSAV